MIGELTNQKSSLSSLARRVRSDEQRDLGTTRCSQTLICRVTNCVTERLKIVMERPRHRTKLLKSIANNILKVGAIVPTQGQLLAVFEDDSILAMEPWLQLFDLVYLDNCGAVNAEELLGV